MAEPRLVLSSSSLSTYLKCHRQYLYANVFRVPGRQNLAAALGSAVHAGAKAFWKAPETAQAALEREFSTELTQVPLPYAEPVEGILADATRMLGTYIQEVAPTLTPTTVEEPFVIEVEGVLLSGTIDAADENDVHDLKTTYLISKFDPSSYGLQMNLYGLAHRARTGYKPKRLLLDVLPRRGRFTYRQYEVKPEVGDLLDVIGLVRDGILAEDYKPTGAISGACHWCPYKEICEYATDS